MQTLHCDLLLVNSISSTGSNVTEFNYIIMLMLIPASADLAVNEQHLLIHLHIENLFLQPFFYLYTLFLFDVKLTPSSLSLPPESMLKELVTVNVALDGVTMCGH